jgi:hypothetical protein
MGNLRPESVSGKKNRGSRSVILETLMDRKQSEEIRQASLKQMNSLEESRVENG